MVSSISFGIDHSPSGAGSMVPPTSAWPSNRIEMKALRSSANAIARRTSRLSNGGADELTMMLVETLVGSTTQTALGAWDFTSFSNGIVICVGNVMSNLPATNPRIAVERLVVMVNSIPSRCGRPFLKYSGLRTSLMDSLALNSTNLNGPVPIGLVRMSPGETWQG